MLEDITVSIVVLYYLERFRKCAQSNHQNHIYLVKYIGLVGCSSSPYIKNTIRVSIVKPGLCRTGDSIGFKVRVGSPKGSRINMARWNLGRVKARKF